MENRFAVVLAAGQGTRMKSSLYKVLHPVCEKPMVEHVIDQVQKLNLEIIVTVVGHGADQVKQQLKNKSQFSLQNEQLGTAHAVMQTSEFLKGKKGTTIVLCGDTPLITAETISQLIGLHEKTKAKATVLTAIAKDPTGYGRIIRDNEGNVGKIVEHKDANEEELKVSEINTGTYCFDNEVLFDTLTKVKNDNAQGEYYLPDVIEILFKSNEKVSAFATNNFEETLGVNDRVALSQAEKYMKDRINRKHMKNGVTIIDPNQTYISDSVEVGKDTVIYPGTIIKGQTSIGEGCQVGPNSEIANSTIGNGTVIKQSVVHESEIKDQAVIGPFAHIRPSSFIDKNVKIGNFVEVKKSDIGSDSKVSHLSYIGDAEVGTNVNIGCGTITVNYDGKAKHLTKIEDDAFIGCNSNLIAPVKIGNKSTVAAGSTITEDVPANSLSIARSRQMNKLDYNKK
ncbi:bifunctional UDP-N-acetylglucosamine diphosphorylase/glucosamine-1-phosphate N-acetyltransferase GlmU [Bacillus carboniphilus]|uniref:Bifunctional protein GlmU n=1 Tax=Bacillus carboniphilus TaxID=86663 RepID=A0ABY9JSY2_9BACI|nr:bifunctional UDP-N-acetylglucosamine diphosphorylase/glucosamine-1-phosphate N-acetyltransferase GlmU [Bacillus carboniphilus]WLR41924.1 bifunctional UDP-N-acetylglucosamine diphosphorylase/glucosamine-1-phosphate N-acetyltransferase GlmU [Bacillus carboniphilus]